MMQGASRDRRNDRTMPRPGRSALAALACEARAADGGDRRRAQPRCAGLRDRTIPAKLGVAFSIDDSGSMSSSDPSRLRSAATGVGIDQLPDGAYAAVSSFDSGARSLVDPVIVTASNRSALKTDVDDSLTASGETHYDLAFSKAKQQLDAMPGSDKRALVFLSDGAPNGGDYDSELDAIRQAGIPVFAIGFGSAPGSVLAQIAASTGGQAYTIQSPGEAQAVFARIVSTLLCDATQVQASVTLEPGETRAFPYGIGPSDREFRALAAWSFGGVTVRLRRPDGSFLVPGAELAGERFISEKTYASVIGRNPAVGGWELQVTAGADNVDEVDVTIDIFRRTSADPPDPFGLVSPAAGAQVPLKAATFAWAGARNAQGYELEIDDRVVVGGLSRGQTSVVLDPPGGAGSHSWRVAAVNQFGRTLSERRTFTLPPRPPVVLVGGLSENNPQVLPSAPCRNLTDFASLCSSLQAAGHPVYVMRGSKGASGDYDLDNAGAVAPNAHKLADFILKYVPGPPRSVLAAPAPLIVGHSMGGLIAHTAISDFGARAAGMFTIGTPHTGSYGADLALAAIEAPCPLLPLLSPCHAVQAAGAAAFEVKGSNAMMDLTSRHRRAANLRLRVPEVPVWAFAGTPCHIPFTPDAYWSPNDGIVGLASAHGRGARLGRAARSPEGDLWHNNSRLLIIPPSCALSGFAPGRPNQFTDPTILKAVVDAAGEVTQSSQRSAARSTRREIGAATPSVAAAGAAPPRRVFRATFPLSTARGQTIRPGASVPIGPLTKLVAATGAFSLQCRGQTVPALRVLGSRLYAVQPAVARCSSARLVASKPVGLLIARSTKRVRATLTFRGPNLTLSLTGPSANRSAVLRAGRKRVKLLSRTSTGGRLTLKARIPPRGRGRLSIEVRVSGIRYAAILPRR